jgi:signal transduction histidine kinase
VPTRSGLDLRFLIGAFAGIALTFFAANAVTQHAMGRIDTASDDLAFNSAPSIQHLAAARTAVRHTEFLLGTAVTLGDAKVRAAVQPALAQLNSEASAYLRLPTFRGEKEFWRELNGSIAAFDGVVQRTLAQLDAGAFQSARSGLADVAAAADRVSDAIARAIEFNAENGHDVALRIKKIRHDTTIVGYALNASCLMLALVAALLLRRQLRHYGALVEEHAALEASRARELEIFAGRAAHDILNPISATQMALELAMRRDQQDPRGRELLQRATRNLHRARSIVDGLLQFARAGARPMPGAKASVPVVIEDVVTGIRPAAEAARIEVRVEGVPACHAHCSVGVLASVISNLAQNAVKYMAEDGPSKRIVFRADVRGDVVHAEVEDTGPGIPPDAVSDIFLPYVRASNAGKDGLGLGLATVKRLCEAHGGRAGVRSAVGRGSVFWIELPGSLVVASPGPPPSGEAPTGGPAAIAD